MTRIAPKHPAKPAPVAVKVTEKANSNEELIKGLKRARDQIWQFYFRVDEAVEATAWLDHLIKKAGG